MPSAISQQASRAPAQGLGHALQAGRMASAWPGQRQATLAPAAQQTSLTPRTRCRDLGIMHGALSLLQTDMVSLGPWDSPTEPSQLLHRRPPSGAHAPSWPGWPLSSRGAQPGPGTRKGSVGSPTASQPPWEMQAARAAPTDGSQLVRAQPGAAASSQQRCLSSPQCCPPRPFPLPPQLPGAGPMRGAGPARDAANCTPTKGPGWHRQPGLLAPHGHENRGSSLWAPQPGAMARAAAVPDGSPSPAGLPRLGPRQHPALASATEHEPADAQHPGCPGSAPHSTLAPAPLALASLQCQGFRTLHPRQHRAQPPRSLSRLQVSPWLPLQQEPTTRPD